MMKIGITYLYTIFRYGYPHSVDDTLAGIRQSRELGFRFVELEGLGAEHMDGMHARRREVLDTLRDSGVHAHNFCVVNPDLVSPDRDLQAAALDGFKLGAELAAFLGCETLHLASYAPPVLYLERKPYALDDGDYQFADRTSIRLPEGFDWNAVWWVLVRSCRACADIAATHGRTVLMEPRVGEVVCSVDSMLRLIEQVDRPNFKANFDTAHFCAQRENVVLALAKLKGRFANIHIADNVPVNTDHLPVGDGIVDWEEFFRVLGQMQYNGYLGLDLGMTGDLVEGYRKSVERIQEIAKRLWLRVEV